jgi:nucleoid-associated protein YgaU
VRPGDTLWSIAVHHYRGDPRDGVWRLQRENELGAAALQPGQVIVIP